MTQSFPKSAQAWKWNTLDFFVGNTFEKWLIKMVAKNGVETLVLSGRINISWNLVSEKLSQILIQGSCIYCMCLELAEDGTKLVCSCFSQMSGGRRDFACRHLPWTCLSCSV